MALNASCASRGLRSVRSIAGLGLLVMGLSYRCWPALGLVAGRATPGRSSVMRWRRSARSAFLVDRKKADLDQPYRSGITGLTTHIYLASLNLLRSHTSWFSSRPPEKRFEPAVMARDTDLCRHH